MDFKPALKADEDEDWEDEDFDDEDTEEGEED